MNIKYIKQLKNGKRHALVELDPGEALTTFNDDRFYRLGGQVDDVVQGHVIVDSEPVYWCSITQKWENT